jgi:hypothetical protein
MSRRGRSPVVIARFDILVALRLGALAGRDQLPIDPTTASKRIASTIGHSDLTVEKRALMPRAADEIIREVPGSMVKEAHVHRSAPASRSITSATI